MTKVNQKSISEINNDNIEEDIQIDKSKITEELTTIIYNEDKTRKDVLQIYEELFHKSVLLINKYIVNPRIGDFVMGGKSDSPDEILYLHPSGSIVTFNPESCCGDENPMWTSHKLEEVFYDLSPPQKILTIIYKNLIKNNKEKIKEVKLALYFLKAL